MPKRKKAVRSRPRSALLPLGAIAAGFGLAGASWAQVTPPAETPVLIAADKPDQVLPGVSITGTKERDSNSVRATTTTVGKGNQEIRDVPQSITVLTEKVIDDLKLTSLRDALHYTAGITFAAAEGGTDQDFRLRGFSLATTGDLLIDGMRDPSSYERDTFNLERIEVMRGSASMLFGRGSTGGVVNQVMKKPELLDQSDVIATVGSRGYFRTTIDLNQRTGETSAFRLNAMETKATNDGPKIDKHGIAPSVRFGIGTKDEFVMSLFYLNVNNIPMSAFRWLNNGPGTQGKAAPIDPENFYGTESDYQKGKALFGTVQHAHRFDDGGMLRSQIRSGVFDRQQWMTVAGAGGSPNVNSLPVTYSNINDNSILTRSAPTPRKDRYTSTYFQSDYDNSFGWLGLRHDILGGVDAANEKAKRWQNNGFANPLGARPNVTVGDADNGASQSTQPIYRDSSSYDARALGAYMQDLVSLTPTWKVLLGGRYDSFKGDFRTLAYSNTTGALTSNTSTALSNSVWSYRGGILYQPTPTASFHVSYGTGFNTSADTYQYVTPQNANTPPEKNRNIEVGAKLDWLDDRLSTRVAIFRTEKYNERTTDADFAGEAFLLSGKRHTQGVELDIVGRITKQLEVYLSASYIPTAIIDKIGSAQANVVGQRVGLVPRTTGSIYVSYEATPKLRLGFGAHGASKNYPLQGTNGAAQSSVVASGYVAADLLAEYKFTPDLFAQLNVLNLKNVLYADQLYQGFYVPGPARSVQLSVGARF